MLGPGQTQDEAGLEEWLVGYLSSDWHRLRKLYMLAWAEEKQCMRLVDECRTDPLVLVQRQQETEAAAADLRLHLRFCDWASRWLDERYLRRYVEQQRRLSWLQSEIAMRYVTVPIERVDGETDKALFVSINGEQHWIPKSQIEDTDGIDVGDEDIEIEVSEWFVRKEDLV